jgi:tRNA threonylcarbamoyl adenosine modification protein TsaD
MLGQYAVKIVHSMSILRIKQAVTSIQIIRIIMVSLFVLMHSSNSFSTSSKGIHRHRMFRPRSTTTTTTNRLSTDPPENALRGPAKEAARLKRKRKIGMAKAIDRGLPHVTTYNPANIIGPPMQVQFQALSGLPKNMQTTPFTVLGIESSCDDTGAAVVRSDGVILGEALAKQIEIHNVWGGVVPGLARDAHVQNMDRIIDRAIANAGLKSVADVDAIAVTVGPGLEICLRVGCQKAVQLAQTYNKPFVGVHHLEAHILMARMPYDTHTTTNDEPPKVPTIDFPFLALLVSGGHCQLLECHGIGQYRILGGTIDDSLGEAYDKTARLLGLPVGGGGGPAVEKLAAMGDDQAIRFTVPMHSRKDFDFSYAGLKTNVRRASEKLIEQHNAAIAESSEERIERAEQLPEQVRADLAASFQNVAIQHIEQRLKRAMDMLESSTSIRTLAVVGGVAANQKLRSRLEAICSRRNEPWKMVVPPPRLCTDQGA